MNTETPRIVRMFNRRAVQLIGVPYLVRDQMFQSVQYLTGDNRKVFAVHNEELYMPSEPKESE